MVRCRVRAADDLPELAAVLRRVHEADGYPRWWPATPQRWLASKTDVGAWVAEVDRRLVAQVGLHAVTPERCHRAWTTATAGRPDDLVEITRLFVAPQCRRNGIAGRLLDMAVEHARRRGKWPVLDVVADDRSPAEELYVAAGWSFAGADMWSSNDGRQLPVHCWVAPS